MRVWKWLAITLFPVVLFLSLLHPLKAVRTPSHGDQDSYLELAANLREGRGFVSDVLSPFSPSSGITHPESVRAPLYPLLLAPFVDRDILAFERAKLATLLLSLCALLVAWGVLQRTDGAFLAFGFVFLLCQLKAYRMYATQLWCENVLLLFAFPALFMLRAAWEPKSQSLTWRKGVLAGVVLGLAHLAKTSAILILLAGLITLLLDLRKPEIRRASVLFSLAFLAAFALVLTPYAALNLAGTGHLSRDVDLQGAFWIDHGEDYWLPHETRPDFRSYLAEHSPAQITVRLLTGLWAQGPNVLSASAMAFPGGEAAAILIMFLAVLGLANEKRSRWRRFEILLFLLNMMVAAWYARIDVTPRFIILVVPLVCLNAVAGLSWLISRLLVSGEEISGDLRVWRWVLLVFALPLLFDVYRAVQAPPGPGAHLRPGERETLEAIRERVAPDEVLAMGPTHALPFQWLIERKRVFIPNYETWEEVLTHLNEYQAGTLLLDVQLYLRRPKVFSEFFTLDERRGLILQESPPGMRPVFRNSSSPVTFWLLERDAES